MEMNQTLDFVGCAGEQEGSLRFLIRDIDDLPLNLLLKPRAAQEGEMDGILTQFQASDGVSAQEMHLKELTGR